MRRKLYIRPLFLLLLLCNVLCAAGCSVSPDRIKNAAVKPPVFSPPKVLEPEAPGTQILGNPPFILDVSNKSQGYLIAKADAGSKKINLQMTASGGDIYSYFIDPGETAVIPFSDGNGNYQIICYQQIEQSRYAALFSRNLDVCLENEFLPYLYPNQYVNFSADSEAAGLALSMLPEDAPDTEALDKIYTYVTDHITYDEEKAASVKAGYLPDVDETLRSGTGICFDYAALMTAMLRSRDIPCKLQIGYAGDIKHAWIDVYLLSKGWVEKAIAFDGEKWTRMDPTFDSNSDNKTFIRSYIGNGENYTVQFTR